MTVDAENLRNLQALSGHNKVLVEAINNHFHQEHQIIVASQNVLYKPDQFHVGTLEQEVIIFQSLVALFGGILIAALCLVACYCYREDSYVRRSVFGGQDRDIIYTNLHPKIKDENKDVRIWSMDSMRDTVADPKLIVINKPSFGQDGLPIRTSTGESSSTKTAKFAKSASEITIPNKKNIELSSNLSTHNTNRSEAPQDPWQKSNTEKDRYKHAGGDDGMDGIIHEVDADKEYTTGNRDSAVPTQGYKLNDGSNINEQESFSGIQAKEQNDTQIRDTYKLTEEQKLAEQKSAADRYIEKMEKSQAQAENVNEANEINEGLQ